MPRKQKIVRFDYMLVKAMSCPARREPRTAEAFDYPTTESALQPVQRADWQVAGTLRR